MDLKNGDGGTVYIKRQWRREFWIPRPGDIWHGVRLQSSPIHEWRGLRILQAAGFHVSEPLAVFWRGWGLARGAVVTRSVPGQHSLADMIASGVLEQMEPRKRESLVEAAAKIVARMNRARIAWRSMKPKHFYPEELGPRTWRIWLIDCEDVFQRASRRECDRQWRMYLQSLGKRAPELRDAFFAAYDSALKV